MGHGTHTWTTWRTVFVTAVMADSFELKNRSALPQWSSSQFGRLLAKHVVAFCGFGLWEERDGKTNYLVHGPLVSMYFLWTEYTELLCHRFINSSAKKSMFFVLRTHLTKRNYHWYFISIKWFFHLAKTERMLYLKSYLFMNLLLKYQRIS